jgi:hypothetical protein
MPDRHDGSIVCWRPTRDAVIVSSMTPAMNAAPSGSTSAA